MGGRLPQALRWNDALTVAVLEYALTLQIEARRPSEAAGLPVGERVRVGLQARDAALEAAAPFLRERIPWSAVHQAFVGPR